MAGEPTQNGFAFDLGWSGEDAIDEILSLIPECRIDKARIIEVPVNGKIVFDFENQKTTSQVEATKQ